MGMGMSMGMTMRMIMLCKVCGEDTQRDDPDAFDAVLRGVCAYKLCPSCKRTVDDATVKCPNYRRRVRRFVARRNKRRGSDGSQET